MTLKQKAAGIVMVVLTAATIGLFANEKIKSEVCEADVKNLAATYTDYLYYGNILTAKPSYAYKDVYIGTKSTVSNVYTANYALLYQWQGPIDLVKTITYMTGTTRNTSFTGKVTKSFVEASAAYTYTSSKAKEDKTEFTFPGDNRIHYLYQSRTDTIIEGYTKRTSYIAYPTSYTWIPLIASWNITWGEWDRYSSRDIATVKTMDTQQNVYGHYMTK